MIIIAQLVFIHTPRTGYRAAPGLRLLRRTRRSRRPGIISLVFRHRRRSRLFGGGSRSRRPAGRRGLGSAVCVTRTLIQRMGTFGRLKEFLARAPHARFTRFCYRCPASQFRHLLLFLHLAHDHRHGGSKNRKKQERQKLNKPLLVSFHRTIGTRLISKLICVTKSIVIEQRRVMEEVNVLSGIWYLVSDVWLLGMQAGDRF